MADVQRFEIKSKRDGKRHWEGPEDGKAIIDYNGALFITTRFPVGTKITIEIPGYKGTRETKANER